ncbi:MAG: CRR6 family NdhI maturation factor [Snowella sp.]
MTIISLNSIHLETLDLSPISDRVEQWLSQNAVTNSALSAIADHEQTIQFKIDFPREENDPRELSEIPEVRLWFVRLDAVYPWCPFLLDWKAGEFARYAAMLVPHQFNRSEGIQYNPEALEIFMMNKIFVLSDWLKAHGIPSNFRLKSMAQLLGYDLDDDFLKNV